MFYHQVLVWYILEISSLRLIKTSWSQPGCFDAPIITNWPLFYSMIRRMWLDNKQSETIWINFQWLLRRPDTLLGSWSSSLPCSFLHQFVSNYQVHWYLGSILMQYHSMSLSSVDILKWIYHNFSWHDTKMKGSTQYYQWCINLIM